MRTMRSTGGLREDVIMHGVRLDDMDRAIIAQLQRDARMSVADLARAVNLSPSPCLRRLRRLERSGAIRGYRVELDPSLKLTAFVGVRLARHARNDIQRFQREALAVPEIVECHHVTGSIDYLLRVEVPDVEAYEAFHADRLAALHGVAHVTTHIAMTELRAGD